VAERVVRRPGWVIAVFGVLAAAAIVLAALRLELKFGQNDMVSNDQPYNQRYLRFLEEFGDLEFLYVVVDVPEGTDPHRVAACTDAIAEELGQLSEYLERVVHRVPTDAFGTSVLLRPEFTLEGLRGVSEEVVASAEIVQNFAEVDSFPALLDFFSSVMSPAVLLQRPGFGEGGGRWLDATVDALTAAARGETPRPLEDQVREVFWEQARHPRDLGYLFTENGQLAFVEILPKKNFETIEIIREPLAAIRRALERVRKQERFAGLHFGLTGRPALQADEMETTNSDMTRSTIIALIGVVVLFALAFRRLRRPILAGLTLIVALALTFGLVTLTIGYLTLLTMVFAAMLVGLGIDFGIHLVARYQEELVSADDIAGAVRTTLTTTGVGIWTGGITTAAAFLSTLLVDFQGLQELGFIAGTGVLICVVTTLTLLPALRLVTDRFLQRRRVLHPATPVRLAFLERVAHHPKTILLVLGVLTVLGLFRSSLWPEFSFNLLELQADGLKSVEFEHLIIERSDRSTWFAAFVLDSIEGEDGVDAVLERLRDAQRRGIVGTVESVRDHISADQDARRVALRPAHEVVAAVNVSAGQPSVSSQELEGACERLVAQLQGLADAARFGRKVEAATAIDALREKVEALLTTVREEPAAAERLGPYQVRWFGEFAAVKDGLEGLLDPPVLGPEGLPAVLRDRFLSRGGNLHAVFAYPLKNIWQEKNMDAFVAAVAAVDPNVTGTPIQVRETTRLMRTGFLYAAGYALVMVFILLWLDLRAISPALWVMVPLLSGLFWLFELMPLLGLQFNLANFFALPILIGAGVDGSVHMLHRFRETGSADRVLRTTGSAVVLSFLTTILGFGSLGLASHRGVASLGYVMTLGCVCLLLANTLLLPALLELRTRHGRGKVLAENPAND